MADTGKKRRINPMLLNVILISAAVHIVALLILGGITVVRYAIPEDPEFDEPPQIEEQEPPPDVQVEVKPQPSAESQPMENLRTQQVGEIAVAEVDVDLPQMEESFTVSSGMGGFGGGGSLLGGGSGRVGLGVSDVNVFGIEDTAERVLFMVNARREMLLDEKGGLPSYNVIKEEIVSMVRNLSAGTLFNVAFYDERKVKMFKPKLVPSGRSVADELEEWIQPINSDIDNIGLKDAKRMKIDPLPDEEVGKNIDSFGYSSNERMTQTHFILEQNADAAFVITGFHKGFQKIRRARTDREQKNWERKTESSDYQNQLKRHKEERSEMRKRVKETLERVNEERERQGQPPRVLPSNFYSKVNALGLEWETPHPGRGPSPRIAKREVERYFRKLVRERYRDQDKERPSINVVLFLAGDEKISESHEREIREYVDFFRGRYRIIRGLNEIRAARTAADVEN